MVSCMVHDEQIMGLCDEMKIAKKVETFMVMMQGSLWALCFWALLLKFWAFSATLSSYDESFWIHVW